MKSRNHEGENALEAAEDGGHAPVIDYLHGTQKSKGMVAEILPSDMSVTEQIVVGGGKDLLKNNIECASSTSAISASCSNQQDNDRLQQPIKSAKVLDPIAHLINLSAKAEKAEETNFHSTESTTTLSCKEEARTVGNSHITRAATQSSVVADFINITSYDSLEELTEHLSPNNSGGNLMENENKTEHDTLHVSGFKDFNDDVDEIGAALKQNGM